MNPIRFRSHSKGTTDMIRAMGPILLLTAWPTLARAGFPRPEPPLPQRVALADSVIVGQVTSVLENPVQAFALPKILGASKVPHHMAVVRIDSVVLGTKDLRELRVGFIAPPPSPGRRPGFQWSVGQQGCFFLRKHPDEPFWVIQADYDMLDKARDKEFESHLALVRRCGKLLEDVEAGLRASDADNRLLTAGMLIFRYRTPQHAYRGAAKTAPIDAGQSQRILAVLAEGEWAEKDLRAPMGRLRLFLRLALTSRDGWKAGKSDKETAEAARAWLRSNASTYRIHRYVADESPAGES
jgi:hypothetical protein